MYSGYDSPRVFDEGGYGLELIFWLKIGVYFSENLLAILEISDFQKFLKNLETFVV